MSFSEKTIRTLEFDKICAMLEEHAETEGAKVMARNLRPSEDTYTVLRRLRRTTDARKLADAKGAPSFGRIRDIASACERAEKGAVLSPRELLDCANVLRTARILQDYHTGNHPFDTVLDEVFDRLIPDARQAVNRQKGGMVETVRRMAEERGMGVIDFFKSTSEEEGLIVPYRDMDILSSEGVRRLAELAADAVRNCKLD
jgi:dsDNA-specific endonuclease/ATPase MutS2